MLEYCLQREDYWMKTLHIIYPYGLNEKTKFKNKNIPVGKLFAPLLRYGESLLNVRIRNNIDKRIQHFDIQLF